MSWQARWLAAWLFCLLNWIGQDYFSPQGWTYLLYLLFVGFLVTWFRPTERTSGRGSEPPRPGWAAVAEAVGRDITGRAAGP